MVIKYGIHHFRKHLFKKHLKVLIAILLLSTIFFIFIAIKYYHSVEKGALCSSTTTFLKAVQRIVIPSDALTAKERNDRCCYYTCFNPFRCGKNGKQHLQIYIYPLKKYVNENNEPIIRSLTQEFYSILQTIKRSKYYTSNPEDACIFVPSFDTLSVNNFMAHELSQALNSLSYWNNGENHLLFNLFPVKQSAVLPFSTGYAIVASAGFDSWTYRPSFDVSLPPYVPITFVRDSAHERKWLVTVSQLNLHATFREKLNEMSNKYSELILLRKCPDSNSSFRCFENDRYSYMDTLQKSVFCVVIRGSRLAQPVLLEAMSVGCIPIILADTLVMPFQEIIDWKKAALFIFEENIHTIVETATSVSKSRAEEMSKQARWLYSKYFSSMEVITNTTLDILNQIVFPENSAFYEDWNLRPDFVAGHSPIFHLRKSNSQSFTAVVLTYDRIDSLFLIIEQLSLVPSLSAILVVWNNQMKPPPPPGKFPNITKPVKVIRTKENKLSNRFLPFKEIETEAVLSLDDDITMLTEDELDFGFEVWKEFPDRIVGFPSRTHVWDNSTSSWRYESEWTNEISMILTGAAFYHKYWHHMYSNVMLAEIRQWVDKRMNCEDIAMNFLVANVTNKAPIKVGPRKKFKCPECTDTEMLSADLDHMRERSRCINKFTELFGHTPLKRVEFRADPVLYKSSIPEKLKKYRNIGSL